METLHKREKEMVGQKIISKQDACSGVRMVSRLVKYHRNILKNNLKHVDVLHFLTAVIS
jgi:hypothetical protein